MNKCMGVFLVGLGLTAILSPSLVLAQTVLLRPDVGRTLELSNVNVEDGIVTGELRNNSDNAIRDAQLLIRYTWLWKNEFYPGSDDPSRSVYYTVPGELAARGTTRFQYAATPPLPTRTDGSFTVSVGVAGFTAVYMPGKAAR
jgi:hypothetical protein